MKNILTVLFLTINAFSSWGQKINSCQTTADNNLFANYQTSATTIHQIIIHDNIKELKNLFTDNSTVIMDRDYFWHQLVEARKYFPTCKFVDSAATFNTDINGISKTIISYRYQYISQDNQVKFQYIIYFTFSKKDNQTKNIDVAFVKLPVNINYDKSSPGDGVYDDFVYTRESK